jgi:hypothetical protein
MSAAAGNSVEYRFPEYLYLAVTFGWMSVSSANLCPFRTVFNFGKSQKLQGAKSVE